MSRRQSPVKKQPKLLPAILALITVAAGFAILLVRLEVIEEGYRLSALRLQVHKLEHDNQQLRLEAAELGSHERLRRLAVKYGLRPPQPGQVVMLP